jgi:hypothetical protein
MQEESRGRITRATPRMQQHTTAAAATAARPLHLRQLQLLARLGQQ